MLLHRKNDRREASSISVSGNAEPGATDARVALDSEQKLRARQEPFDGGLDARLETVLLAAAFVESEQLAEIVLGLRAAIRAPCKLRQDLLRACGLGAFGGRLTTVSRLTYEDPLRATRRFPSPSRCRAP